MMSNEFDSFEAELISLTPVRPSQHSRLTIARRLEEAGAAPGRRRLPIRGFRWTLFATSLLVLVGLFTTVFLIRPQSSVLAAAVHNTKRSGAWRFVETWSDSERAPDEIRQSQWWVAANFGALRISKVNGQVVRRVVWRGDRVTTWTAETNQFTSKPSQWKDYRLGAWLVGPDTLLAFEKQAKIQEIPIRQETIVKNGRRIRRIRIDNIVTMRLESAHLQTSLEVDVDDVANRIVRQLHRSVAVGENRENFSVLNACHEFTIEYPNPSHVKSAIRRAAQAQHEEADF